MICNDTKTPTRLPLAGLEGRSAEGPHPPQRQTLHARTLRTPEVVREYHRQWRQAHPERCREYSRKEYRKHYARYQSVRGTEEYKAKMRDYAREQRAKNPEKHKASLRRYYREHREEFRAYRKANGARRRELYQERKEQICARKRALTHTDKYRRRSRNYLKKRRQEEPQFALADALRATMNRAFRRNWIKKPARTETLLGCTISEAKTHIEAQFVNGMSWTNRRSFVIDHIVPISAFDLTKAEHVRWAFNWRNLRPIMQHENAVKSSKLPDPLPEWLPATIASELRS